MRALLVTQHQAGQRGWPFSIVAAGLPNLPRVLTDAHSYAERLFDYRTVARLPSEQARAALVDPAGPLGLDFEDRALALLLDASGGYPYFLQEYGRGVWDAAPGPRAIIDDAGLRSRPAWPVSTTDSSGRAGTARPGPNAVSWSPWRSTATGPLLSVTSRVGSR